MMDRFRDEQIAMLEKVAICEYERVNLQNLKERKKC